MALIAHEPGNSLQGAWQQLSGGWGMGGEGGCGANGPQLRFLTMLCLHVKGRNASCSGNSQQSVCCHTACSMMPSMHQPSFGYLQLGSLFIRWGSVVIISAVLLLPWAVSCHGCAGGGQVYVAQHRMTIFISLCYHIIYLLDPAEDRDDCVKGCLQHQNARDRSGMLADCAVVSYIRLWASPACDQQRPVQAVWQLTPLSNTQAKCCISADSTSTAGGIKADEQVDRMMPDDQGQFQADMLVSHTSIKLSSHDPNSSIVATAIACCTCAYLLNSTETHE